jgi:hypothetical protein
LFNGYDTGIPVCMIKYTALRLIVSAALIASAGCGRTAHAAPSVGAPIPTRDCVAPTTMTVTVTEADNGRTYCLARSTHLEVYLHGTAQNLWTPITLDGDALRPVPSGKGALPIGVTAGFFIADHAGAVHLSSTRRACPTPSSPGVTCGALLAFRITVMVR